MALTRNKERRYIFISFDYSRISPAVSHNRGLVPSQLPVFRPYLTPSLGPITSIPSNAHFPEIANYFFCPRMNLRDKSVTKPHFLVEFSAWSLLVYDVYWFMGLKLIDHLFVGRSLGDGSLMFSGYVLRIYASQNAPVTPSCPVSGPILTILGVAFWHRGRGGYPRERHKTNTKSIYARPLSNN